jgi:type 1 glutamine amidotransferase
MFKRLSIGTLMLLSLTAGAWAGDWVNLFDGKTLNGWSVHSGFAKYHVEDGMIVGTAVKGSPNSFLCTDKEYGNFILELEVKCDPALNSGVQIRSQVCPAPTFFVFRGADGKPRTRVNPPDRVHGYQVEIANAKAGTSGGIYDEARRAFFLADVSGDPAASTAFKDNQWNKYRIECRGSSIKTWVNGVPCADLKDSMSAKGVIGLQVHHVGGNFQPYEVRWRNIRIRELGETEAKKPLNVVVITGGHAFEHDAFFKIFGGIKEIHYTEAFQKDDSELFENIDGWNYDVMVFYNMGQKISPKRRRNLLALLDRGVGVVVLHHTLCAYQDWPEFKEITGGKYYLKDTTVGGVVQKAGVYQHGLDIKVHIADRNHPITQGMSDYTIHDEAYKNCWFAKDNHVLLTTNHPVSDKTIAWVRQYHNSRVFTIQSGHDSNAYENPNYQLLIKRAILWTAARF